jgi:hypothetical protein
LQHNPKDPLNREGREAALFEAFGRAADGHDVSTVASVSMNTFLGAIRTAHATREAAERAFDEYTARAKGLLLDRHYDPVTNRRRNVFPFTQVVHAEIVHWDPSKN